MEISGKVCWVTHLCTTTWMAPSWLTASWDGCFLVFLLTLNKSKNLVVILLTLNKSKKLTAKLSWEKLESYASFFGCLMPPALHPGFLDP